MCKKGKLLKSPKVRGKESGTRGSRCISLFFMFFFFRFLCCFLCFFFVFYFFVFFVFFVLFVFFVFSKFYFYLNKKNKKNKKMVVPPPHYHQIILKGRDGERKRSMDGNTRMYFRPALSRQWF